MMLGVDLYQIRINAIISVQLFILIFFIQQSSVQRRVFAQMYLFSLNLSLTSNYLASNAVVLKRDFGTRHLIRFSIVCLLVLGIVTND